MSLEAAHISCTLQMGSICDKSFSIVTGCRFLVQHCKTCSRDSVVNIATSHGTDSPGCESRWRQEIFLFSDTSIPALGAQPVPPPPFQWAPLRYISLLQVFRDRGPQIIPSRAACWTSLVCSMQSHVTESTSRFYRVKLCPVTRIQWVSRCKLHCKVSLSCLQRHFEYRCVSQPVP